MSALPKFRLNKQSMTAEEFSAAMTSKPKGMRPGNYDVKVKQIISSKPNEKDPTWYNVSVEFENSEGATIRRLVMIPTAELKYAGSPNYPLMPAKSLTEFYAALGETLTLDSAQTLMTKYFGNEAKALIGKSLNVTVGYKTNYVKYVDRDTFEIVDKDGHPYKVTATEKLPVFNSRDEAFAFAKEQGIKLGYLEILKFEAAETVAQGDDDGVVGDDFGF